MALYDSILLTGGGGMLAVALKRSLDARGARYAAPGRAELDVCDAGSLKSAFDSLRPTLVLNCAAYTKVDQAEKEPAQAMRVNGDAVGLLASLCRDRGAALVHYSTDYVFDGTLRRPLRPDDPTGPQSSYGRSKLAGETALRSSPPSRWLILRTAWLYGPGGASFVQTMLNAARAAKPLKVVGDQSGSPTFTHDLGDATLDLLDRGAHGVFHVTNAGETNWHDFAAAIFEEFGIAANLSRTTSAEWKQTKPDTAARPAYSVLDLTETQRVLGRPMRHWREALRDYQIAENSVS